MTPSQPVSGDRGDQPAASPPSLSAPLFKSERWREGGKAGGRERDLLTFYEYKGVCNVGLLKSPKHGAKRSVFQMT